MIEIHDPADPRVAPYRMVRDPALARETGCFVVEGRVVLRRLLASGRHRVRSLLLSPAAVAELGPELLALSGATEVFVSDLDLVRAVTSFNLDRGCLALVERPAPRPWRDLLTELAPPAVVVLERIGNPDNVGGIFRSAAAFGLGAVLLGPGCADPLYRKAVRTSMGATTQVAFADLAPWPDALPALRALGWSIVALTPHAEFDLRSWSRRRTAGQRIALLLGQESTGLSPEALAAADVQVAIPMAPGMESLNVATAAAIALYEAVRGAVSGEDPR